jgi:hypothetical protein
MSSSLGSFTVSSAEWNAADAFADQEATLPRDVNRQVAWVGNDVCYFVKFCWTTRKLRIISGWVE